MYLSFCSIDPTRKIRAKPDMKSITFKSLYQSALLSILQLKNNKIVNTVSFTLALVELE